MSDVFSGTVKAFDCNKRKQNIVEPIHYSFHSGPKNALYADIHFTHN